MRALLGILGYRFSLSSLEIYCATAFWPAEFLVRNKLITLWGFPCMLFVAFPLLLLIFFSLSFISVNLITVCLGKFLLGFVLYGTLRFLDLGDCFLSQVREVFSYYAFKYVFCPFLSLSRSLLPLGLL